MQVALFCCFRQGVAGMSRDLGRDVPDLEKLYARKLWADFSYNILCAKRVYPIILLSLEFRHDKPLFAPESLSCYPLSLLVLGTLDKMNGGGGGQKVHFDRISILLTYFPGNRMIG